MAEAQTQLPKPCTLYRAFFMAPRQKGAHFKFAAEPALFFYGFSVVNPKRCGARCNVYKLGRKIPVESVLFRAVSGFLVLQSDLLAPGFPEKPYGALNYGMEVLLPDYFPGYIIGNSTKLVLIINQGPFLRRCF